jgi:hypothetical protein
MLRLKNTAWLRICILVLVGCTPPEKPEPKSKVEDTVQSEPPKSAEAETKTAQKTFSDSLIVEQPIYEDTAKILLAGQFHKDEVWPGAGREQWFGLFPLQPGIGLQIVSDRATKRACNTTTVT